MLESRIELCGFSKIVKTVGPIRGDTMQEETNTDEPIHVRSGDDLEGIVASGGVVLADFYADWCGPCRMLEPIVEAVAVETAATVAKVDIDEQRGLAAEYAVQSVPTMVLFADGEPVERLVGVKSKEELTELVEGYAE